MSMQVRVRVPEGVAKSLLNLNPRQRANVLGLLLAEKRRGSILKNFFKLREIFCVSGYYSISR